MFDQAKADAICALISEGESLRKACEMHDLSHSTFLTWARDLSDFANQYARARDIGTDLEFEALGEMQSQVPERGPGGAVDSGWVAWKRLQVDTQKWALAKKAPKKYGEKLDLTHGGEVGIRTFERRIVDATGDA